ncbi:hypothetical protein PHMEG_00028406, partial [Phytophthora megakarya]
PRSGCFNCGKDHFLSDCPDADEAQKEAILAKRTSKSKAYKKHRVKRVEQRARDADRVRPMATINGALDMPYCADSGVDARLTLNTATRPLRCQNLKRCLVVESNDSELIVGRLLLMELGIDVDPELEQLAARDISDNDEFGDPNGIPLCAVTLNDDIAKTIEAMVTGAAIREVVDAAGAVRLRRILSSFTGWRLVLGDDPPARVPPLELQLKPNARPYRCKVRQYSQKNLNFWRSSTQNL